MGRPYWSLSAYLKGKTKKAVQFIDGFEQLVAAEARRRGVDGVVCGHIHQAELRRIGPVLYANTGDWVESCTALAEDERGRLEILRWPVYGTPAGRVRPSGRPMPLHLEQHRQYRILTPPVG